MTATIAARRRELAEFAGPLAKAELRLNGDDPMDYVLSCRQCKQRPRWTTFLAGAPNNFQVAGALWADHLKFHHAQEYARWKRGQL